MSAGFGTIERAYPLSTNSSKIGTPRYFSARGCSQASLSSTAKLENSSTTNPAESGARANSSRE